MNVVITLKFKRPIRRRNELLAILNREYPEMKFQFREDVRGKTSYMYVVGLYQPECLYKETLIVPMREMMKEINALIHQSEFWEDIHTVECDVLETADIQAKVRDICVIASRIFQGKHFFKIKDHHLNTITIIMETTKPDGIETNEIPFSRIIEMLDKEFKRLEDYKAKFNEAIIRASEAKIAIDTMKPKPL